jgi:hypothetical protein
VAVIDKGDLVGMDTPAALLQRFGRRQVRSRLATPWSRGVDGLPEGLRRRGATLDAGARTVVCPVDGTPIAEILSLAATLSTGVVDVEIVQPTLEDVFLQLTGRADVSALGAAGGESARP